MPNVILVLGPVVFRDFEVPSAISFGGRQVLAIHQLTDGRRVIDSIGASETAIVFSGAFSGLTATSRARQLNSLRIRGNQLSLTWDIFHYTVTISDFDADYQNPTWIPYHIRCIVLRDDATPASIEAPSVSTSILSDLALAAHQCTGLNIDFLGPVAALSIPTATTLGTPAYLSAQSCLSGTQVAIATSIASSELTFQSTAISDDDEPAAAIASIVALSSAVQQLAESVNAAGFLGRASKVLADAST